MLLAFSSFFFTGGNDQSILSHPDPGELLETGNRIQNYAGARGAQLSQFLINDCFGIPAYFIIVFLVVAGMKLMKAYEFKLWKWFISCTALMVWFSVTLGFAFGGAFENSFLYPGGLHGYNASQWICSQIGAPGLILVLLVTGILIAIFFTKETIGVVRKAFHPSFPKRNKVVQPENENTAVTDEYKKEDSVELQDNQQVSEENELQTEKEEDSSQPKAESYEDPKPVEIELDPIEEKPLSSQPENVKLSSIKETAPMTEAATDIEEEITEHYHEPAFEISNEHKEEDEEYRGNINQPYNPRLDLEHYKFPTLDLLNSYGDHEPTIDMEEQNANKTASFKFYAVLASKSAPSRQVWDRPLLSMR